MASYDHVFQFAYRDEAPPAGWAQQFFGNDHPLVLELGCGHGEYTVGLAKQDPTRNYIGIDIKGARMWAGAKQAKEEGLTNVAFLRIRIETLEKFFGANEVEQIWITFPDPQMKKATKRLTSTYFMQRYHNMLCPHGLIRLKTDSPFLYTYTREMIRLNQYPLLMDTEDLYNPHTILPPMHEQVRAIQTHYERQWLERGMTIKYLEWQLPEKQAYQEPDIEIEKDSYRSYGRNYNA